MYEEHINAVLAAHTNLYKYGNDSLNNSLIVYRIDDEKYIVREDRLNNLGLEIQNLCVVNRDGESVTGKTSRVDERFFVDVAMMEQYKWMRCVVNSTMKNSMIWTQSGVALPPISVIHPKYFYGEIPISAPVLYKKDESYTELVIQEVLEVLRYGTPQKCKALFVPRTDCIVWGESISEAVNLTLALEALAEQANYVAKECEGCFEYLPYDLVREIYNKTHK